MPGFLAKTAAKAFPKSLWLYHCNSGACNGCDIEILNVLTPYYDVERFGLKLVGSPRHADVMLLSGAVTRPTLPLVKRAYEAMPSPKLVFGIGSCAAGGGCWFDTYNVTGRRGDGRPGRLSHSRLPAPARGDHLRRGPGSRPGSPEVGPGRAQAG